MSEERQIRLLRFRELFWRSQEEMFPPHMIQFALDNVLAPPSRSMLSMIDADPNSTKALFKNLRETEEGAALSRPRLTSVLVGLIMLRPLEESLEGFIPGGDLLTFIVFHDFAVGLRGATGQVFHGEASLKGNLEEETREQFKAKMDSPIYDLDADIATYLSMKAGAERAKELLEKDSTGFMLYDDFVDSVKTVAMSHTVTAFIGSHIPEFVLAGAELARDLYKKVYPLAS